MPIATTAKPPLRALIANSNRLHLPEVDNIYATFTTCGRRIIDAIRPRNVPTAALCKRCFPTARATNAKH